MSGYGDDSSLQGMIDDLTPGAYDESSYLALLDVLVALSGYPFSKQSFSNPDSLSASGRILHQAHRVANIIETKRPELVKSRPYLRWILAEAEHSRRLEGDVIRQYLSRFPGVTVYRSLVPIYIPKTCENPGWPDIHAHPQYTRLVQIALKTARAMGDYQTEVLCLQELICRSSHPRELFEQLKQRQREMEGNSIASRQTRLSMYLLQDMGSSHSLEAFLNEYHLASSPTRTVSRRTQDGLTRWCYVMLQRAFATYAGQDKDEVELEVTRLSSKLPNDVSSIVNRAFQFSRPHRVSIPYSSDSDYDSDDYRDHKKEAEVGPRRRSFSRNMILPYPPGPSVLRSFPKSEATVFCETGQPTPYLQPLIDSEKEIHDSTKVASMDQMVQTEDSNYKHTVTPHIISTESSTEANKDPGNTNNSICPAQDKQPQEVEAPPKDKPSKQAQVHEPSSSSE